MSLSSFTQDHFDLAREELHIPRGLQSVGETRFGTIYWSLNSVIDGIPAFKKIVRDQSIGIESQMLHDIFDDDEDVFIFLRDLKRLGAILMPFARAIQCLEAKDTNPSDVYTYWLAIVAHLHDIMVKDDALKEKAKYSRALKEKIRAIANFRFSQLIEDDRASNIYLTAFVLDPENRAAPNLENPNPLAIPSITITREKGKKPAIKTKAEIIHGIGLSLLKLLQREYGDEYRTGRSAEEARKAMEEINPRIAHLNPHDAISALKKQFKAYLVGVEPFTRRRGRKESLREYWCRYLMQEDSDILAALAVKIFSAMPVSMVDERAMSVVTWLNAPRRKRQAVSTVSNHLAIRNFNRMDTSDKPKKPVTINWRDIQADIKHPPMSRKKPGEDDDIAEDDKPSGTNTVDPENDPMAWLDDGLPDLSGSQHAYFDLQTQFDISRYIGVLADSVSDGSKTTSTNPGQDHTAKTSLDSVDAGILAPEEGEWTTWD